jgi:hypothetical protein
VVALKDRYFVLIIVITSIPGLVGSVCVDCYQGASVRVQWKEGYSNWKEVKETKVVLGKHAQARRTR